MHAALHATAHPLPAALLASALRLRPAVAAAWAPVMAPALQWAQITTAQRLACWLAQLGHESGQLRWLREIWGPTAQQLRYEPITHLSRMLGNSQAGDGQRYLGRGLIQVTGRANCRAATQGLRHWLGDAVPDFEAQPELLALPHWAAMSAARYWHDRRLNECADARDFAGLTRRINGGTTGLAQRQALYSHALSTITLECSP